jgi:hypothetical protein
MKTIHLSEIELSEYHLGFLSNKERGGVRQHLAQCALCTMELAILEDYMASLASTLPPEHHPSEGHIHLGVVERVKVVLAKLISGGDGLGVAPPLAYGTLRDLDLSLGPDEEDDETVLEYQVGDEGSLSMWIEEDEEQPTRKRVIGLLEGMTLLEPIVYIWQNNQPDKAVVAEVDQWGNFELPGLLPGEYQLILSSPASEIQIQALQV